MALTFMGETFNPFIYHGKQYFRFVERELPKHPSFKSALVIGVACLEYNVFFLLPKTQAFDCYRHIFQSFGSRSGLAREHRNVYMDD